MQTTRFSSFRGDISTAFNACSMTESNMQTLLFHVNKTQFMQEFKLIMYEKLQVLKENKEKLKKEIDDAYKQIEEEIKSLPIE